MKNISAPFPQIVALLHDAGSSVWFLLLISIRHKIAEILDSTQTPTNAQDRAKIAAIMVLFIQKL